MKNYIKNIKPLMVYTGILGILLVLVACGSGSGGGSDAIDEAGIQNAISSRVNTFKTAVEDYNLTGMLGFLDENDFQLTIVENGISYDKDYTQLETELTEDEAKQLYWRLPAAQGGYAYTLTMEIGTISYSNLLASGAVATVPFTIKEEADGIAQIVTDTGSIICEVVKLEGEWCCRRMTINYNIVQSSSQKYALRTMTSEYQLTGFGFGQLNPED